MPKEKESSFALNFFSRSFTEVEKNRDTMDWYKNLLWQLLRRKCHNLRLFMACFACENPSPFYLSEAEEACISDAGGKEEDGQNDPTIIRDFALRLLLQASTKIMTIFSTS